MAVPQANSAQLYDIEEIIDRVGLGPFQRRLLAICGLSWAADAAEVLIISFALPAIRQEWGLSPAEAGLIVTATFLGMLAGAWFWGTISDYIGRRTGFVLTVLIFSVFGTLAAFAPSPQALAVLRALTGFGLGGALPLDFSIFAEFLPRQNRGRYLVILESFWALGTIIGAGLAWVLVPAYGWRPLLATSAVAALLVFWIRLKVPESPRFLATHGRLDEAWAILGQVAQTNGRTLPPGRLRPLPWRPKVTVAALWRPEFWRVTLMLWVAWFCISLAYYGVFSWLPQLFVQRGFAFLQTYQYVFILALAQLPGYFSAAYLVERWGRRLTLATYLVASGIFAYLFAVVVGDVWIVAAAVLMSFFSLGAWGALYAYTPELYPTEIRTTGMGWASGMTRIAGSIAPTLGGVLLQYAANIVVPLSVWTAAFIVGGIVVALLGVETRGKPLADTIEAVPKPAA